MVVVAGGLVAKSCPTLTTPWIVAHQAPLPMEFPRKEYWSGLPFPSPGRLSNDGLKSDHSYSLSPDRIKQEEA